MRCVTSGKRVAGVLHCPHNTPLLARASLSSSSTLPALCALFCFVDREAKAAAQRRPRPRLHRPAPPPRQLAIDRTPARMRRQRSSTRMSTLRAALFALRVLSVLTPLEFISFYLLSSLPLALCRLGVCWCPHRPASEPMWPKSAWPVVLARKLVASGELAPLEKQRDSSDASEECPICLDVSVR